MSVNNILISIAVEDAPFGVTHDLATLADGLRGFESGTDP